jgi:hypothetical protein
MSLLYKLGYSIRTVRKQIERIWALESITNHHSSDIATLFDEITMIKGMTPPPPRKIYQFSTLKSTMLHRKICIAFGIG